MAVEAEAMSAEHSAGSFHEAEGERWWSIPLLFLMVLVVDVLVEVLNEWVMHAMEARHMTALIRAWTQLKFEIMALGVVSLLLVVFETQLLSICVQGNSSVSEVEDSGGGEEPESHGSHVTNSQDAPAVSEEEHATHEHLERAMRRLLAGGAEVQCPKGKEALWPFELIHKVHLLIFLIAAAHIVYSSISILMSMLAMSRWYQHESSRQLMPLPLQQLRREGEPAVAFFLRQTMRQFTAPIDAATYVALRFQFIEISGVGPEFNFSKFVSDLLTDEVAAILKLDVFMWVLAILWVIPRSHHIVTVWVPILLLFVSVAAGGKLQSVLATLAHQAYSQHYEKVNVPDTCAIEQGDEHGGPDGSPKPSTRRKSFNPAHTRIARTSIHQGKRLLRALRGHSQKIASAETVDYASLFWLRRPRLLLRIFQYAYFQNSLSMAMISFALWQGEPALFHPTHSGRIVLSIISFLLLLHTSMYVMPVYALTAASVNYGGAQRLVAEDTMRIVHYESQRYTRATAMPGAGGNANGGAGRSSTFTPAHVPEEPDHAPAGAADPSEGSGRALSPEGSAQMYTAPPDLWRRGEASGEADGLDRPSRGPGVTM